MRFSNEYQKELMALSPGDRVRKMEADRQLLADRAEDGEEGAAEQVAMLDIALINVGKVHGLKGQTLTEEHKAKIKAKQRLNHAKYQG